MKCDTPMETPDFNEFRHWILRKEWNLGYVFVFMWAHIAPPSPLASTGEVHSRPNQRASGGPRQSLSVLALGDSEIVCY